MCRVTVVDLIADARGVQPKDVGCNRLRFPIKPLTLDSDSAALVALYRAMVLTRAFDTKAIALQRTGKIGTFASALGQEAVGVGTASAMRADERAAARSARARRRLVVTGQDV